MYQDKYTVLIQGPLDMISLCNLENYKNYGEVVISCWSDTFSKSWSTTDEVKTYLDNLGLRYSFEKTPDISKTIGCNKKSTFYYALNSMYNGLKLVKTNYVIKTRSDEYYKELTSFIEEFEKNDDKIVCGNIFVRNDYPWHFGDHIFICKTKHVLNAVENLLKHYNGEYEQLEKYMTQESKNTAELILCLAILQQKNVDIDYAKYTDYKSEFLNYISIVNINDVGEFTAQWKACNKKYINYFNNHHNIESNDDY
jgi:hypothetical protein